MYQDLASRISQEINYSVAKEIFRGGPIVEWEDSSQTEDENFQR